MSDRRRIELWTAAMSAAVDRHSIDGVGLPSPLLMERAALSCSHEIVALRRGSALPVRVVCGPGNNGADGWAVARQLHGWGVPVSVVSATAKGNDAGLAQRQLAAACGVATQTWADASEPAIVVDALLGTGSRGAPRGEIAAALASMRAWAGPRVAIDLPSGVDPDTGACFDDAVRAATTVTFGRSKPGLHVTPGRDHAGRVVVAEIGLIAPEDLRVDCALVELAAMRAVLRLAADVRHKGDRGHVGVQAGSADTPGAAVLAALAAFRGGAGLVTVITDAPTLRAGLLARVPEAMLATPERAHTITAAAWVIGPGLTSADDQRRVAPAWRDDPRPAIWDAGGLEVVDGSCGGRPRIITPHPGEAARLLARLQADASWTAARVQADRLSAARALAQSTGAVVLLKGAGTILAQVDRTAIVTIGGPALATAGSGDVLAGILGALLARGIDPWTAAQAGAVLHAAAGEVAGRRHPATIATDLVDGLDAADGILEQGALPELRLG